MSRQTLFLDDRLYRYLVETAVHPTPLQRQLCEVTASTPLAGIESSPEQVQLLQFLLRLTGARRCLEIGVFTGYSTLAMALALPADGRVVACDIDRTVTDIARIFWERAGVAHKIDLRLARALDTLDALLDDGLGGSFDFAYVDADKRNSDAYYEKVLALLGDGRLMAIDNIFWGGHVANPEVADEETSAIRALNEKICGDPRVETVFVPLGDGLALVRKRPARPEAEPRR